MKCPNCNKEISDGFKFCPYCATPIVANACPHCGSTNIPADSKFCPDCGNPIKGTSEGGSSCSESGADTLEFTVGGVSFKMIHVEGGTFQMGATPEMENPYDDEMPVHEVTLSSYLIGETPVTQALWEAVMGNNPSCFKGDNLPVESVSWHDCQEFVRKLNAKTGKKFRLPTEAEWEFAARGGNASRGYQYSGSDYLDLDGVAWYICNSGDETHNIKELEPNELGIYDMSGNVSEWCQDWYGAYNSSPQTNPTGPKSGFYRVYRGGCWYDIASFCRLSYRQSGSPNWANFFLGFRLALSE